MPDIRIKDLTTTASTTAADDFFAADGTTNGTRKLSAFSPTFGGNATVGGTLTVNGAGSSTVAGKLVVNPLIAATKSVEIQIAHAINTENCLRVASDNGSSFGAEYGYGLTGVGDPEIRINRLHAGTVTNVLKIRTTNGAATLAGSLSITDTTASTTTSSGALVVGNGTSGGLGVGGNASIGGTVFFGTGSDVQASRAGAGVLDVRHPSNTTSRIDVQGATSAGLGLRQSGTRDWFVSAESNELRTSCLTANSVASYESGVLVRVRDTTASNSTSSGALVVSGGVGVAGAIYAGADIITTQFGYSGTLASNALTFTRNSFNYFNLSGGSSASLNFNATTTTANDTPVFSYNNTRVTILTGTASTNTSSGALQVTGGVGVSGAIYANAVNALTSVKVANTSQSVPAYGDVGPQLSVAGAVITDTSSSGTVSRAVVNSIASSALAASSTTTYTQAASLFVAGAPTANANVTITNAYAIYTAGGRINFQGLPTSSAGLQAGTLWNDAGTLKVA